MCDQRTGRAARRFLAAPRAKLESLSVALRLPLSKPRALFVAQSWGPTLCRLSSRRPRVPRLGILPGERAACGSGAGPREPRGGGYGDNLGRACGKQPLGCRLFAVVNPTPEARPFPPGCRFFPATRLRAAGGCVCRQLPGEAGTVRPDAQVLHPAASRAPPGCRDWLAGLCKPLESVSATCNFGSPFFFGNFEICNTLPPRDSHTT